MEACNKTCSAVIKMKKCNLQTKKCEDCKQGDPGCNTEAHCEAQCGQPHAKCNNMTGTCEKCEPATDKNCTMTTGACDTMCKKQTLSKCNKTTGKCDQCSSSGTGCVPDAACNKTCSILPPDQAFKCDWSKEQPTCMKDKNGTMTEKDCTE